MCVALWWVVGGVIAFVGMNLIDNVINAIWVTREYIRGSSPPFVRRRFTFAYSSDSAQWPIRPPNGWPRPTYVGRSATWFETFQSASSINIALGDPKMQVRTIGVPFRCVCRLTLINPATPFGYTDCGTASKTIWGEYVLSLTYGIWWPGFAANSAIFGACAFGAWRWASAVRRRRRDRCLCAGCRYSLVGLPPDAPCPECGTPSKA